MMPVSAAALTAGVPASVPVVACASTLGASLPSLVVSVLVVSVPSMFFSLAEAATLADVLPSAPRSTKLISPSVALRTTFRGPVNSRPFTVTAWLSLTNSNCSTPAPMLACQGKPLRAEMTTSRAAAVSREMTPSATSWPSLTRMAWEWPTPLLASWPKRMGRACEGIARPARSTTTGYRQPATRMGPPV
ncbi:MAG: hypothetical protein BWX88_03458 [Planctomycetes bacterium ADurb.Bin126]|nr:MAG: hypothetical protein BWX88_03458 [Planctomycetes bacterium ADurb.Bin126]